MPTALPDKHIALSSMLIDIIANITLFINLGVGFYFYRRLEPQWLRWFTWLLMVTLIAQAAGSFYSNYFKKSNHFIFNIYIGIEFLFYFLLFHKEFRNKKTQKLTSMFAVTFTVFYLCKILFGKGLFVFSIASYIFGSVLTIICCLLYFVWLFVSDEPINYFRIPMFWIATGLLFYYVGESVYMSLLDYLVRNKIDEGGHFYTIITVILNLLLYTLTTFGFLSNRPWQKRT